MRIRFFLAVLPLLLGACEQEKVYHAYVDFEDRAWLSEKVPQFTFSIGDTTVAYDVYCNVRNSTQYPYSRIFIQYSLGDTLGHTQDGRLIHTYLFDAKTGEPLGKSGLGDLYDHQIPILKNHKFKSTGPHRVRFEQYMRTDTLTGIISVGLGVEHVKQD